MGLKLYCLSSLEGKNGVEASELDVSLLTSKPQQCFGSDREMRTAFLDYNGEPFLLKIRGAAVTRPPYFDTLYGHTKLDIKLPEDQQGHNILGMDQLLGKKFQHVNIMFPELNEDFEARPFTYGSSGHFMGLKVAVGRTRVWKTVDKTTTELDSVDALKAGDDVDLLLSAVLWFKRSHESVSRAGWSWKVEQVKILRRSEGGAAFDGIEKLVL